MNQYCEQACDEAVIENCTPGTAAALWQPAAEAGAFLTLAADSVHRLYVEAKTASGAVNAGHESKAV